jgi:hypothetical protein
MNIPAECFPQNLAQASLNQIGGVAETASPSARRTTHCPVVTSFGSLPKLPLQNCAGTAIHTLQPVWAELAVSAARNLKILSHVNGLTTSYELGGVNHPLRGWGRTPQGVFSHSHPQGVPRAWPFSTLTSQSDDGGRYRQASTAVVFHPSSQPEKETTHG